MSWEDDVREIVVFKGEDTDASVTASSSKMAAGLRRRPGHEIHGSGMMGKLVYALPLIVLLPPNQDAAVI